MFLKVMLTAVGLSMDAFSLAILYGTSGISKKNVILLSSIVGIYHFFMPILGFILGHALLNILSIRPNILVGSIFLILSLQMFFSSFKQEEVTPLSKLTTLLLFGFTVSIDSFMVGIGLGTITNNILMPPLLFSITSFSFTLLGLVIGKILNNWFGTIATILGSILLFFLSLSYIL